MSKTWRKCTSYIINFRHKTNMLSKVSFFVCPKSQILSLILIFIQIFSSYWKIFNLQLDKCILISKSVKRSAAFLCIAVDLFHCWVYPNFLYCAISMFTDTRNMLSKMAFFIHTKSPISSKISSTFVIVIQKCEFYFLVQNATFHNFVFRPKRMLLTSFSVTFLPVRWLRCSCVWLVLVRS